MNLFVLPFPAFDPIALELGPVSLRWYGLAYMSGLLIGWYYIRKLLSDKHLWNGKPPFSPDLADDLLIWTTLGVVIGGRLGFIFLYEPSFFIQHPMEVFAVWHGGMAFHGGLMGSIFAIYLFARRHNVPFFSLTDIAAAAVPIGLFFGRLANFINAEIVGKVSNVPWAMVFPNAGAAPRHPTQLYEAGLEGIVLFLILRFFTHKRLALNSPGMTGSIFLMGYGTARILVEFFKEHDHAQFFTFGPISTGMVYSLPMILLGMYLYKWAAKNQKST